MFWWSCFSHPSPNYTKQKGTQCIRINTVVYQVHTVQLQSPPCVPDIYNINPPGCYTADPTLGPNTQANPFYLQIIFTHLQCLSLSLSLSPCVSVSLCLCLYLSLPVQLGRLTSMQPGEFHGFPGCWGCLVFCILDRCGFHVSIQSSPKA